MSLWDGSRWAWAAAGPGPGWWPVGRSGLLVPSGQERRDQTPRGRLRRRLFPIERLLRSIEWHKVLMAVLVALGGAIGVALVKLVVP
jgi:hypothetical protein